MRDTARAPKPTMQYRKILYDTMRYCTIQCNILQYHAIPCNTMKYHAILMHYHKIHCNTIRNNSIIRFHAITWINMHFWPKNDNFRQLGLYNGLPSSRMGTYHKTKGIQDMGMLWSHLVGSVWGKKGGLYGCSVNKSDFWAIFWPKNGPWCPPGDHPAMCSTKKVVLGVSSWWFEAVHKNIISGPKNSAFGQLGPWNGLPNGQTATYRKTEGIQS